MWMLEQYGINHRVVVAARLPGSGGEVRRHPAARGHDAAADRRRPRSEAERSGRVGLGRGRRRAGLAGAARVRAERRHAAGDRHGRRDRARSAGSADRARAAGWRRTRRAGACGRRAGRQPRQRAARRVQQSRAAHAGAARSRRGAVESLLLSGIAADERVRSESPGRVGHAGVVADLLRVRSGVPAAAVVRHRDRGRRPLSARRTSSRAAGSSARNTCATRRTSSSFRVGKGYVVTYGSQIDFRAQPRATFKLLFNGDVPRAVDGGFRRRHRPIWSIGLSIIGLSAQAIDHRAIGASRTSATAR